MFSVPDAYKLFVGNIPKSYTEDELRPVSCGCDVYLQAAGLRRCGILLPDICCLSTKPELSKSNVSCSSACCVHVFQAAGPVVQHDRFAPA
jgi:hypothetical protein